MHLHQLLEPTKTNSGAMQYSEGSLGRVFVIRTEDGEDLIDSIQDFVTEKKVRSGVAIFLGALREGLLITGPKEPTIPPGPPFVEEIDGGWEILGVATIYPNGCSDEDKEVTGDEVGSVISAEDRNEADGKVADDKIGPVTRDEVIEKGPKIHIHTTAGRDERVVSGCLREKATTYLIVEVILIELLGLDARRELDDISGLYLLSLGKRFP